MAINMRKTLENLFEKSILLGDEVYSKTQINSRWIGNPPATIDVIQNTERRLTLKLPQDYIELVTIANGFPTCCNSVEPSFQKLEEIDFIKTMCGMLLIHGKRSEDWKM